MKKRILIIMTLLLTTGCTCEYNLTINENTYTEEVIIIGENAEEISQFDKEWQIPINKDEYNNMAGSDSEYKPNGEIYALSIESNKITFNHNFIKSNYNNSTAVSNCYNKITITNYNNTTILSTSSKVDCFDKYPPLRNIKVNIKVDKPVISNNADSINGNIYTWNITKNNSNDKSINLILENDNNGKGNKTEIPDKTKTQKNKGKYDLYVFLIILLAVAFIGYKFIMKFKDKNNTID